MYLPAGLTPANIILMNMVITSRRFEIIRKAEKQLLNERIWAINTFIEISSCDMDACVNQLISRLDQGDSKDCQVSISWFREAMHKSVWEGLVAKFNRCDSKHQVATQKTIAPAVVARNIYKCTVNTVVTQTLQHPATPHAVPQPQTLHTCQP